MKSLINTARIAALVLILAIIFITVTSCGSSAPDSTVGDVATGITWSYDSTTNELKINGTGMIPDWDNLDSVPWSDVKAYVKTLTISEGITKIGYNSFSTMELLESATLPASITEIGKLAFAFCPVLKTVAGLHTSGLRILGEAAFEACPSLTSIYLPASIENIGTRAFAFCSALETALILGPNVNLPDEMFYRCLALDNLLLRNTMTEEKISDTAFKDAKKDFKKEFADIKPTDNDAGTSTIRVKYIISDGADVAPPDYVRENTPFGITFSVLPPEVPGYKPDKATLPITSDGMYKEEIVTYSPVAATADPSDTDTSVTTTAAGTEEPKNNSLWVNIFSIAMLVIVIAAVIALAVYYMKTNKREENKKGKGNGKNNKKK